jgi:Ca2+/H+ antiporter, TMEM165/GDT1 family
MLPLARRGWRNRVRTDPGKTAGFAGRFHAGAGCGCQWSVRRTPANEDVLDAFLISTGLVSIAEIGDKTMLLAIMLAAAWRRPTPILLGILAATLGNHAFAALAGTVLARFMDGDWMRWVVGVAFLGFAVWALIPDRFDERPDTTEKTFSGVFWTTTAAFFIIEMGDKTQVATAVLAAQFQNLPLVVAGSTLGMMLVNGPAVLLGEAAAKRLPLKWIRLAAAAGFAATGLWVLAAG